MNRPESSSSLLTNNTDERASLLNELWLLDDKNDLTRDLNKDSSVAELRSEIDRLKAWHRLSPREKAIEKFYGPIS